MGFIKRSFLTHSLLTTEETLEIVTIYSTCHHCCIKVHLNYSKYSFCCHLKVNVDSMVAAIKKVTGVYSLDEWTVVNRAASLSNDRRVWNASPWKCLHRIPAVEFQTSNSVIMSAGIKDTSCLKQFSTPPRASCYFSAGAFCDRKCINHRAGRLSAMMTLIINTADRWP